MRRSVMIVVDVDPASLESQVELAHHLNRLLSLEEVGGVRCKAPDGAVAALLQLGARISHGLPPAVLRRSESVFLIVEGPLGESDAEVVPASRSEEVNVIIGPANLVSDLKPNLIRRPQTGRSRLLVFRNENELNALSRLEPSRGLISNDVNGAFFVFEKAMDGAKRMPQLVPRFIHGKPRADDGPLVTRLVNSEWFWLLTNIWLWRLPALTRGGKWSGPH